MHVKVESKTQDKSSIDNLSCEVDVRKYERFEVAVVDLCSCDVWKQIMSDWGQDKRFSSLKKKKKIELMKRMSKQSK